MTLLLVLGSNTLFITVTDFGPTVPHPRSGTDSDEHGRGTAIVRLLARWTAIDQTAHGRVVHAGLRWESGSPPPDIVCPDGVPLPIPQPAPRDRIGRDGAGTAYAPAL